jgi:hypothetical protein
VKLPLQLVCLPLALSLGARDLHAGTVITWREDGVRKGKGWSSHYRIRSSPAGLKLEITESTEGPRETNLAFVYLRSVRTVYLVDRERPEPLAVTSALVQSVEARARAAGKRPKPGRFSLVPLGTESSLNGFTCKGYALKRPGQTTRILCLADRAALGIDEDARSNLREMGALLVPFMNAARLLKPDPEDEEAEEGFDTFSLPEGFPVRDLKSRGGVVVSESQLLGVTTADIPADTFHVPGLGSGPATREPGPMPH